jgi:hypothetical protein
MQTTVKLKNGSSETAISVQMAMIPLREIAEKETLLFYELVQLCRDPQHQMLKMYGSRLKERYGLVSEVFDGKYEVHASVRNVVLSAVTGDDSALAVVSPYEEQTGLLG